MQPGFRFRLYLLTALILFGCGALLSRLYTVQIEMQAKFIDQMPGTTAISVRDPGVRGDIVDRNGVVLAENLRNYEIIFNLEEIHDSYRRELRDAETEPTKEELNRSMSGIVDLKIMPKLAAFGLDAKYRKRDLDDHYRDYKGHVPYTFRKDLTFEQFALFAENAKNVPGVQVATAPQRRYPLGSLASHILGKVQRWHKGNIPSDAQEKYNFYTGEGKGIEGIEASMNEYLRGPEGARTMLKDEKGNIVALVDYIRPGKGATVELTIDARVQCLAERALRRVGRAAAVVMDVNTGEVLAMASVPDYDPNDFVPPVSKEMVSRQESYNTNRTGPYRNRCISQLAPGSTFKIATSLCAFSAGITPGQHVCNGVVDYGASHNPKCWIYNMFKGTHGPLSLEEGIQRSCNPYFYILANKIGSEDLVSGFDLIGFGKPTGISLPNEQAGLIPGSRYWKRVKRPGSRMRPINEAHLSIGQGDSLATPLQLASMISAVANGGKLFKPRIVKQIIHPENGVLLEDHPELRVDLTKNGISDHDLARIREGMYMAVNVQGGTAGRTKLDNITVAAKTGTAQASEYKNTNNSWTIAFAPYEEPRYAVVVAVENGGSGGKVAGPLVKLILKSLFSRDEGLRLPLHRMTPSPGDLERYEEVILEDDDPILLALEPVGETGNEIGGTTPDVNTPILPEDATTGRAEPSSASIPEKPILNLN